MAVRKTQSPGLHLNPLTNRLPSTYSATGGVSPSTLCFSFPLPESSVLRETGGGAERYPVSTMRARKSRGRHLPQRRCTGCSRSAPRGHGTSQLHQPAESRLLPVVRYVEDLSDSTDSVASNEEMDYFLDTTPSLLIVDAGLGCGCECGEESPQCGRGTSRMKACAVSLPSSPLEYSTTPNRSVHHFHPSDASRARSTSCVGVRRHQGNSPDYTSNTCCKPTPTFLVPEEAELSNPLGSGVCRSDDTPNGRRYLSSSESTLHSCAETKAPQVISSASRQVMTPPPLDGHQCDVLQDDDFDTMTKPVSLSPLFLSAVDTPTVASDTTATEPAAPQLGFSHWSCVAPRQWQSFFVTPQRDSKFTLPPPQFSSHCSHASSAVRHGSTESGHHLCPISTGTTTCSVSFTTPHMAGFQRGSTDGSSNRSAVANATDETKQARNTDFIYSVASYPGLSVSTAHFYPSHDRGSIAGISGNYPFRSPWNSTNEFCGPAAPPLISWVDTEVTPTPRRTPSRRLWPCAQSIAVDSLTTPYSSMPSRLQNISSQEKALHHMERYAQQDFILPAEESLYNTSILDAVEHMIQQSS